MTVYLTFSYVSTFLFYKHIFGKSTHFQRIAHMASFDYHGFITLGRKDLVSFQSTHISSLHRIQNHCKFYFIYYLFLLKWYTKRFWLTSALACLFTGHNRLVCISNFFYIAVIVYIFICFTLIDDCILAVTTNYKFVVYLSFIYFNYNCYHCINFVSRLLTTLY